MSGLAHSPVTWQDFLLLPERPETGQRYELHDGEVVVVPPARPLHIKLQKRIEQLLEASARDLGVVTIEFPYRPILNLQFWFADVAYIPKADWDALPPDEYPVYAPPLIVEVLSPSNTPAKVNRQRIVAMSAGTQEFWVVDPSDHTVQVTSRNGVYTYGSADIIPLPLFAGATLAVEQIFA
jgi:Uma2 family endonuclease